MFHDGKARAAVSCAKRDFEEHRESPAFDVSIHVRSADGRFVEHYGRLSIHGFYFETSEKRIPGQLVEAKFVLIGFGIEVDLQGRIIGVSPMGKQTGVFASFSEIPFDTERFIARWLDMMSAAVQKSSRVGT
jgi:hypothetical protein